MSNVISYNDFARRKVLQQIRKEEERRCVPWAQCNNCGREWIAYSIRDLNCPNCNNIGNFIRKQ